MAHDMAVALDERMADNFLDERVTAFKRLQSDIHAARWKQGKIIAEIRAELGHEEGIKPFSERTGIGFEELRRLEDMYTYFDLADLDPDVPVGLYQVVGTECRRGEDGWPNLIEEASMTPVQWIREAMFGQWDATELQRRVRDWTGRKTAQCFIAGTPVVEENAAKAVERGVTMLIPNPMSAHSAASLGGMAVFAGGYGSNNYSVTEQWGRNVCDPENDEEWPRERYIEELATPLREPVRECIKRINRVWSNIIEPELTKRENRRAARAARKKREETVKRTTWQAERQGVEEGETVDLDESISHTDDVTCVFAITATLPRNTVERVRHILKRAIAKEGGRDVASHVRIGEETPDE